MIQKLSVVQKEDFNKNGLGLLLEIPDPPKELWCEGTLPPSSITLLSVVGSREYSTYGKQVVELLISGLAGYPVGIVSGLALGIDTLAHEAALKAGLYTLSVPGSGLHPDYLYPARNRDLATRIVASGGGLLSEYPPETSAATWTFPARNRIMAGLTVATLLIEAGPKSGTLITARLAVDYNRELLAVPGNIFSKNSYGVHQFIKLGATVVTSPEDILEVLHIEKKEQVKTALIFTKEEELVLSLLTEPKDKDSLLRSLPMSTNAANILLMEMEIKGYIHYDAPLYSNICT